MRTASGSHRLGIDGMGDGGEQVQPMEMGMQICDGFLCTHEKYEMVEDEISDYMPMVWRRQQRQDAHHIVHASISTTAVGKGTNRAGKLDDNGKNGTNDMDNNSNVIKKVEDRRRSYGVTGTGHIQDACPGQTRMEPSSGRGTHYAVAHVTRTILGTDQIMMIGKEVDIQANKEALAGSMGYVETQKQCPS